MDRLTLGWEGERFAMRLFSAAGIDAQHGAGPGDILLGNGLSVEVKASLPGQSGRRRFQFCVYRESDGLVKTDALKSDLVILLAYAQVGVAPVIFGIPSGRLKGQKTLKLPRNLSAYTGKWSWYRGLGRAYKEMCDKGVFQ